MSAPTVTKEELKMVKDALIVPVMLDYLQDDLRLVATAGFKLDLVLIIGLKRIEDQMFKDHIAVKAALKRHGIKIYSEQRTPKAIEAKYLCRGYHHEMMLLWDIIRTEILKKASHHVHIRLTDGG